MNQPPHSNDPNPKPPPGAEPAGPEMGSFLEQLWAKYSETAGVIDAISIGPEQTHPSVPSTGAPTTPADGEELIPGRYRLDGELARGGMGAILKIWDETIRRDLAMKVILESAQDDVSLMGRFLEEAQITGQLEHPGIVPVHEIGFDTHGRLYFTMRLVRGHDLRTVFEWVRRGEAGWTRTRALNVVLRICEAVAYAHSRGVIHRDIKPANVMVGSFGEVYVMDWGLAKVRGTSTVDPAPQSSPSDSPESTIVTDRQQEASRLDESPLLTAAGSVVGTPAYMSPEQARGELDRLDARTDVYAVGALLYALLTGRMPYVNPDEKPTADEVVARVRSGPPRPIAELDSSVPPELIAIGEKAMAHERDGRYADMGAMASDLRAYLEQRVVSAYQTGAWAEFRKWVQRNRALATSVGVSALVVLLGSITFSWYTDRQYREIVKLEDLKRLEDLEQQATELYPARPELLHDLRQWISDADALERRCAVDHSAALRRIREKALPYDDAQRRADVKLDSRYSEFLRWVDSPNRVQRKIEMARQAGDTARLEQLKVSYQNAVNGLKQLREELETPERNTFLFADPVDTWRHDSLVDLLDGVRGLKSDAPELRLYRDIERRIRFAETVMDRTVESVEAVQAWSDAAEYARNSERYRALQLTPQVGLLPLGPNPKSGLLEFWHPLTGDRPELGASGQRWIVAEQTGMVFVLIPGQTFQMGDASYETAKEIHHVTLEPYFISKYEMTQGQWLRFTRSNPSGIPPSTVFSEPGFENTIDLRHPVETVTWNKCTLELQRMRLTLPTEAQWECAARAESSLRYGVTDDFQELKGEANFVDVFFNVYSKEIFTLDWTDPDYYATHCPVDAFPPNPYGLHGVLGNVREFCLDRRASYTNPVKPGTGERDSPPPAAADLPRAKYRIRGGNYRDRASETSLGRRYGAFSNIREAFLGLRPARLLDE